MNSHNNIQDELNGLGSNLPGKEKQPFEVPQGYFEGLASSVLAKIKGENLSAADELQRISPFLAGINRTMPFSVPAGYFENLGNEAPFLMQDEVLPEVLKNAERTMPYLVPNGYFENLPLHLAEKLQPKKPQAKVVSIGRSWMKYAAAAIVTGIIATTGVLFFSNKNTIDPTKQPDEWVAKKLENVSTEALDDFIETTGIEQSNTGKIARSEGSTEQEIKKLLKDVSDEELDMFLSQLPAENEELLIN